MSWLTIRNGGSEKLMGALLRWIRRPSARPAHLLDALLISSLFRFEDLDSNMQPPGFRGARRAHLDIHVLGKNPVFDLSAFLASVAFHFEPPELRPARAVALIAFRQDTR
jgi:hypothetical protein